MMRALLVSYIWSNNYHTTGTRILLIWNCVAGCVVKSSVLWGCVAGCVVKFSVLWGCAAGCVVKSSVLWGCAAGSVVKSSVMWGCVDGCFEQFRGIALPSFLESSSQGS